MKKIIIWLLVGIFSTSSFAHAESNGKVNPKLCKGLKGLEKATKIINASQRDLDKVVGITGYAAGIIQDESIPMEKWCPSLDIMVETENDLHTVKSALGETYKGLKIVYTVVGESIAH